MFTNIGEKLKSWARIIFGVLCGVGGILCIIIGIVNEDITVAIFVAPIILGITILVAWCTVAVMYAFGELVQSSLEMNEKMDVLMEEIRLKYKRAPAEPPVQKEDPASEKLLEKIQEQMKEDTK